MEYAYIHSQDERRVFKVPLQPQVTGDNKRGFTLSMSFSDIRAENRMLPTGQWEFAVRPYVSQSFDPRYTKEEAIDWFMNRHRPKGRAISEQEFALYEAEYQQRAEQNK
jgi:hypothetical protein